MGRSVVVIQAQMDDEQALQAGLSGLNSPSQVAIFTLWKNTMSIAIFTSEALWDLLKAEIEETIANQAIGSDTWLQARVFEFQYSTITPQILQLIDFVPTYNPVDETLQIITRCSVTTQANKVVSIKVAQQEPPIQLDALQLTSLTGYVDLISFAGIQPSVQSFVSDKLFLEAEVFFDGQFASTISDDVIAALTAFLADLPFDGAVHVQDLTDAIQAVTGVTDLIINNMAMRADSVAFGSKTFLVQGNDLLFKELPTVAGYIVEEDTAGETFTDKLTFTPE